MNLCSLKRKFYFLDPSDKIITEDGLDCTFIRNVVGYEHALNKSKIDPKIADLSLSELLMGFFDFYAQFEFSRKTICVESGRLIPKRIKNGPLTLDVINPLDPKKNTAVNIYGHCIEKFKRCCKKTCEKINREVNLNHFYFTKKYRIQIFFQYTNIIIHFVTESRQKWGCCFTFNLFV